jgi:hypothetical protein
LAIFAVWLFPAGVALDVAGCNDGSTGCCKLCVCACGNDCAIDCSARCTQPRGCACTTTMPLTSAALSASGDEAMSMAPDAGEPD